MSFCGRKILVRELGTSLEMTGAIGATVGIAATEGGTVIDPNDGSHAGMDDGMPMPGNVSSDFIGEAKGDRARDL